MLSDDLEISDFETQFQPQSGDEATVWPVEKILAENDTQYKVKWKGKDGKGKPWKPSWEPKHNVTDDLVTVWKKEKAKKRASLSGSPISKVLKASRSKSITRSPAIDTRRKPGPSKKTDDPFWDDPPAGPSTKKRKAIADKTSSVIRAPKRHKTGSTSISKMKKAPTAEEDDDLASVESESDTAPRAKAPTNGALSHRKADSNSKNKGKGKETPEEEEARLSESSSPPRKRSSRTKSQDTPPASSIASDAEASEDSDFRLAAAKQQPRSRPFIISSQDHDDIPPDPFGQPHLLHNDVTDLPVENSRVLDSPRVTEQPKAPPHLPVNHKQASNATRPTVHLGPTTAKGTLVHVSPRASLSPGAQVRLKEFDDDIHELEKEKENRVQISPTRPVQDPSSPGPIVEDDQIPHEPVQPQRQTHTPYDNDEVVPETETQSSTNSQHHPTESLISRMKPRSPVKGNKRPPPQDPLLKPVPFVSPSAFLSHLPRSEDVEDEELPGPNVAATQDTIDQFSSPERSLPKPKPQRFEDRTEQDRQDAELLRERGLELYDQAKKERMRIQKGEIAKKKSFSSLLTFQVEKPATEVAQVESMIDANIVEDIIPQQPDQMELDSPKLQYPTIPDEEEKGEKEEEEEEEQDPPQQDHPPHVLEELLEARNEIARLSSRLSEERTARETLERDRQAQLTQGEQEAHNEIARLSSRLAEERTARETLEQDHRAQLTEALSRVSQLENDISLVRAEKDALFTEVTVLKQSSDAPVRREDDAVIEELKASLQRAEEAKARAEEAKVRAEKDSELFKQQYLQASSFNTDVRKENAELLQRAEVAEGQARDGVAMVKATFQQRIKFLEDTTKQAHRLAEFVIEKDQRTNDDVRRRAAEYPEMQKKLQSVESELENSELQVEELESAAKSRAHEVHLLKKENVRLSVELSELKQEKINDLGLEEVDPNQIVFRCQMRAGGGQCLEYFKTREELENHIYYSGHLDLA